MIETGGAALPSGKSLALCPTALRFNVSDIEEALAHVREWDPGAEIVPYQWGSVIRTHDPDGNRISIRDAEGFERQVSAAEPRPAAAAGEVAERAGGTAGHSRGER